MSGDVQPRKRKDKKRKKDEVGDPIPYQPSPTPLTNPSPSDDFNIHVHEEGGTGGGICAKLVFFVLFFTLAVLIGLIITEHRGLTEVEVIERNSRFSQLFEGWIDKHPNHEVEESHDEQDIQTPGDEESEENGDDDEETEDELPEESIENEDEDEEMDSRSQEEPEEQSQELELESDNQDDDEYGSDEDETNKYESKEVDNNDSENEEEDTEEQQQLSEEADEEEREESEEQGEEDDEGKQISNEDDEESKQISDEDENDDEEKQISEQDDNDEQKQISKEDENLSKHTNDNKQLDNDELEGDEKLTPVEKQEGNIPEEGSSLAVKLGVGAALLLVAQHVLVKKWRSASSDKPATPDIREQTPDLTRRNTIVVPPDFKEIQPDIEQDDKAYSEERSDEEQSEHKTVKDRYTELRSTYTRSLSPGGEGRQSPDSYEYKDEELSDEELEEELEEEEDVEEEEEEDGELESEEDDYNYERNEELLRRLESKYGKLPGNKEVYNYEHQDITNKDDFKIRDEIDEAQKFVEKNPAYAVKLFAKILNKYPSSPRSIYGRALALDNLAEQRRSNDILFNAIEMYTQLLKNNNVPDRLFQIISQQCIKRTRFVGQYEKVIDVHKLIIDRFPQDPKSYNDLSITYLSSNRIEEARSVLKSVLKKWPMDGVALVHYGFILKTTDNKLEEAVQYLKKGIETGAEGVADGRFYFHLGDALARLGRLDEAMKIYEQGTKNGIFLSKYQRSLYNVQRLKGKPFWELTELPHSNLFKYLKQYWQLIRDEGMSVLNQKGYFLNEAENLREFGDWKQFELYARGRKNIKNCEKTPFTCSVIDKIPDVRNCKRGQTKFSVIHPGTHIWPHCGPTNSRLRIHLGLKVPAKTYLRVASETRTWENGGILIFDDSFEHEVWHNGTGIRLVLIIDVWHHELTADEKKTLSPI